MELHVYNTDLNKYTECGTGKQWMAWLFQKKKKYKENSLFKFKTGLYLVLHA